MMLKSNNKKINVKQVACEIYIFFAFFLSKINRICNHNKHFLININRHFLTLF